MFRSNMFELADRLVGIYKTENCTKSVTLNQPDSDPAQSSQDCQQVSFSFSQFHLYLKSIFLVRSSSQSSLHPLGHSNHTMEIV